MFLYLEIINVCYKYIRYTLLSMPISSSHSLSSGMPLSGHASLDALMLFLQVVRSRL